MINLIIFIFLTLEFKNYVDAAAWILPPQEKPKKYAHLKGCYVPELDKVLRYDKPYSPCDGESCIQYTCNTDGNTYFYSCGVISEGEGCKIIPGNKYLPYPKCCDSVECKKRPVPVDIPPNELPIDKPPVENPPEDTPQIQNPPVVTPVDETPTGETPQIENPTHVETFDNPQVGNDPDPDKESSVEEPPAKRPIDPPNCDKPRRPICPRGFVCIDDPVQPVCKS
ncbi:uncharacterized protein LOC126373368 [Pectinophora gossypiella]|uniref:uncharacterized protein LOC126373368 n=1 Tax=Pectinophora gossypiella TaxID=13191 RepID=UPI00214DFBA7|nr:uncharacterized protein LOC126373368 [Pectinophora gossypiella]